MYICELKLKFLSLKKKKEKRCRMDYGVISLTGCVVVRVFPSIPKIKKKEAEEASYASLS